MTRALVLVLVSGCTAPAYDLRATSTLTVTPQSGAGESPFEALVDQTITVEITFAAANHSFGADVPTCSESTYEQIEPAKIATGAMPDLVQTQILGALPDWIATLELCTPASGSSVQIRSDNSAGLALTVGCHDLPPNAQGRDGDNHPTWTSVELATNCDATLYDQLRGRLYGGTNVSMRID
jgi:hypothetical protein